MNANTTSSSFGGTNGVHNQNAFGAGFGAPSAGIGFASDSSFTSAFGNDNSSAAGEFFNNPGLGDTEKRNCLLTNENPIFRDFDR